MQLPDPELIVSVKVVMIAEAQEVQDLSVFLPAPRSEAAASSSNEAPKKEEESSDEDAVKEKRSPPTRTTRS